MAVLAIALKNIKLFLRTIVLIPVLIGMPVFQIYILSTVMGTAVPGGVQTVGFVDIVLLQTITSISPSQFFAASMLVMFLLITGMIAATSIIEERENHTLTRIFAAPLTKGAIFSGNLLGQVMITLGIAGSIIVITHFLLDIRWGTAWLHLFLVTVAVIYVAISLGFVFAGLFKDSKTAGGAMSLLIIVMSFLSDGLTGGGHFGPVSTFTINKWAYESYIAVMEGQPLADFFGNLVVLAAVGTTFAVLATILFRRENIYE